MTGQQVSDALFLMREGCGRVEEMQWNHAVSPLSPSISPSSPLRYFASGSQWKIFTCRHRTPWMSTGVLDPIYGGCRHLYMTLEVKILRGWRRIFFFQKWFGLMVHNRCTSLNHMAHHIPRQAPCGLYAYDWRNWLMKKADHETWERVELLLFNIYCCTMWKLAD